MQNMLLLQLLLLFIVFFLFFLVVSFISANGWYVVGLLVLGYLAWLKLEPKLKDRLRKKEKEKEVADYQKSK